MMARRYKWKDLTLAGVVLLWIGSYMFPFGYAETFKYALDNWFNGDYAKTTWFFYAWTSAVILIGAALILSTTNTKPGQIVRKIIS